MILVGDVREKLAELEDGSVRCCVTSPPYWGLRDYGHNGQLGLEETPEQYVENMVQVFREVRRVLTDDGTLWLNLGDSYNGVGRGAKANGLHVAARATKQRTVSELKPKDLCGIPWRVAFALQADGWWLRSDIIWAKPNPMPESVTDRPTKAHEYIFLLSKNGGRPLLWRARDTGEWSDGPDLTETLTDDETPRWRGFDYYYDADAIREDHSPVSIARARRNRFGGKYNGSDPAEHGQLKAGRNYGPDGDPDKVCHPEGRNKRSVWIVTTKPFPEAHFAVFPLTLPMLCIQAGSAIGDTVLDPFAGAGTTGVAAQKLGREFVGIELNPEYAEMAERRINGTPLALELGA